MMVSNRSQVTIVDLKSSGFPFYQVVISGYQRGIKALWSPVPALLEITVFQLETLAVQAKGCSVDCQKFSRVLLAPRD